METIKIMYGLQPLRLQAGWRIECNNFTEYDIAVHGKQDCYELHEDLLQLLGQFTRNYTQTVKRAADNKRRYAPGEGSIPPVLLSGVSKGVPPLAHDFACKV